MKRKYVVLLALAVVIGGSIAWQSLKPKAPTKVVTAKVERVANLRSVVKGTGEIRAREFVDLQAEVTGVITELSVKEGDSVQKGAELLRLEDLQLRAEAEAAAAQLGAAEADAKNAEVGVATAEANLAGEHTALANVRVEVEQAKISCERAEASYRRKQQLFEVNLIGGEEIEIASAEARLSRQRLQWNEARIAQAEANLKAVGTRVEAAKSMLEGACKRVDAQRAALARANDMVTKTVLRAPLSGLITKLNVEKGERAIPGFQSNPIATLMTIADMSVIEAEIRVAEADIVEVKVGAVAEVEVYAMQDLKFAGTVTEIGQSPIQTNSSSQGSGQSQDGKEFKVVIRLQEPSPDLRPGFTATATIVTATRTDVLVVPFPAQTAREVEIDAAGKYVPGPEPVGEQMERAVTAAEKQKRKERTGVFLVRDGRARFQPIRVGVIGDTMDVEVLEGMSEGDEVISGPNAVLRTLKDWDHVEIDQSRSGAAAAAASSPR